MGAGELIGRNFTAKDHADLIAAVPETRDAAVTAKEAADAKRIAEDAARTAQAAGGPYPQIIVFVAAGAVVTCTDGVMSIEETADNELVVFDVSDYGEWTVSAVRDDIPSDTVTITVDTAKQYTVALTFFASTITVTVEADSTVICKSGGRTQMKTSDGSVIFTVISAATYTVTASTGGETTSGMVEITAPKQAKTITLEYFRSTITVNVAAGTYVTCTDGATARDGNSNGSVVFEVHHAAAWRIATSMSGRTVTGTVTITASGQTETAMLEFFTATITVNVEAGSTVTCTKGAAAQTETSTGSVVFTVVEAGTYTITAEKDGQETSGTVQVTTSGQTKTISLAYVRIYGVSWDGSSTTKLSRTDDAGLFADPAPAVGTGAGFSPFDDCYPWNGMTKVTDGNNVLVKIPKYWVKVQHNPFRVQIADKPTPGYQVSPAHRDRGDGFGERDAVYIGRYECDSSYQSRSGQTPKSSTALAAFRTGIAALGARYWQANFALQLTWWYLYLVEFADWDGQTAIGKGNCEYGPILNTGGTDSMTYHTGRAAGTDGNVAVQYRNIENPWGNVLEWRDGIIFSGDNICTYNNPVDFKDTYNGAGAAVRSNKRPTSSGWIKAWGYDTNDESFIYPSTAGGSESTYVPDYCYYNTGVRALCVDGVCNNGTNAGPFYLTPGGPAAISVSSQTTRFMYWTQLSHSCGNRRTSGVFTSALSGT